jgi:hypothetical protein
MIYNMQPQQTAMLFFSLWQVEMVFTLQKKTFGKTASSLFAVRRLIKPTWLNDRDQFLQPDRAIERSV